MATGSPPLTPAALKDDNLGEVERVDFPRTPPLPFSPLQVGLTDAALIRLDVAAGAGRSPAPAIAGNGLGQANLVDAVTATADLDAPGWLPHRVRTRGFTTGTPVQGLAIRRFVTINWEPGGSDTYLMDQVEVLGDGIFGQPGDSGSLVLDAAVPTAVGLLWGRNKGGFAPAGKFGYFSDIRAVQARLGFSTVWP